MSFRRAGFSLGASFFEHLAIVSASIRSESHPSPNVVGRTNSEFLSYKVLEILDFYAQLGITLSDKHIPFIVNVLADALSWHFPIQTEYMLCKRLVGHRCSLVLGQFSGGQVCSLVELTNCQLLCHWGPGIEIQSLYNELTKVFQQPRRVTLIALVWAVQPSFPQLLSLLVEEPEWLPSLSNLFHQKLRQIVWHLKLEVFHLHTWRLSEHFVKDCESSQLRVSPQSQFMNVTGVLASNGQLDGISIPYHQLSVT